MLAPMQSRSTRALLMTAFAAGVSVAMYAMTR